MFYDLPKGSIGAYFPETNPVIPVNCEPEKAIPPASKRIPVHTLNL